MVPRKQAGESAPGTTLRQFVDLMEPVMTNLVKRFAKDESGATAVEYGLVAAGISVAIIAVMQGLGSKLNTTFSSVQSAFK
jgi:pilus assembly protein Flp/PilA